MTIPVIDSTTSQATINSTMAAALSGGTKVFVAGSIQVLIPTSVPTMQDAIDVLIPIGNDITIDIHIESGHHPAHGIYISGQDCGQFQITSADTVVTVDGSWPADDCVVWAANGSQPPALMSRWNMMDLGNNGYYLENGCYGGFVGEGMGIDWVGGKGTAVGGTTGAGLFLNGACQCAAYGSVFNYASKRNYWIAHESICFADRGNGDYSRGDVGAYVARGSTFGISYGSIKFCQGHNLRGRRSYTLAMAGEFHSAGQGGVGGYSAVCVEGATMVLSQGGGETIVGSDLSGSLQGAVSVLEGSNMVAAYSDLSGPENSANVNDATLTCTRSTLSGAVRGIQAINATVWAEDAVFDGALANISNAVWSSTNGGEAILTVDADLTRRLSADTKVRIAGVAPSGFNGAWLVKPLLTITGASWSGSTATFTFASNPMTYFASGQTFRVTGVTGTGSGYNRAWAISSITSTSITATLPAATITNATWASTSGGQATFYLSNADTDFSVGDTITVSGVVATGGTGYNGDWQVHSASGSKVVVKLPGSGAGSYSSGGSAHLSLVFFTPGTPVSGSGSVLLAAGTVKVALPRGSTPGIFSAAGTLRAPGTAINAVNSRGSFATSPLGAITAASWASTSGGQATFALSTDLTGQVVAGQVIGITGVISTGGTTAGYNGLWTVVSISSTTLVVTLPAASSPGTYLQGGSVTAGLARISHYDYGVALNNETSFDGSTSYFNDIVNAAVTLQDGSRLTLNGGSFDTIPTLVDSTDSTVVARTVFGTNISGAALLLNGLSDADIAFSSLTAAVRCADVKGGSRLNTESAYLTVLPSASMAEVVRVTDSTLVARNAIYRGGTRAIDNDSGEVKAGGLNAAGYSVDGVRANSGTCRAKTATFNGVLATITGAVWASGQTTFNVSNDLTALTGTGKTIHVFGTTATGGTGFNGAWVVVSVTSATVVVTQVSSPGTYVSGGSLFGSGHDARVDNDGRIWLQGATTTQGSAGVPSASDISVTGTATPAFNTQYTAGYISA